MTDITLDNADLSGVISAAKQRASRSARASRLGRFAALCAGAVIGLTMALGDGLPSGAALKTIVTSPQIRIDFTNGGPECVCGIPVTRDQVSPYVTRALVAFEDRRFRVHVGVDWIGLGRAFVLTLTGRDFQGGSTITQQLAKNMIVGDERFGIGGPLRKLREAIVALRIEAVMSKDEILTAYLNSADFRRSRGWTAWGSN